MLTANTIPERWRVFCAIDLPVSVQASLMKHIDRLRVAVPDAQASWSRAENTHLTLKFFGDVQTSRLTNLSNAADRAVKGFAPFQITIENTGVFPKRGAPNILWIGVRDESGKLAELQSRLDDECAVEGFAREEKQFHPHLTIARLRKPQGARTLAAAHEEMSFEPDALTVAEVSVIRSEPSRAGSRYTVISSHGLNG